MSWFKRRRPTHRTATVQIGYRFPKSAPELCKPCVDLYGIEAVRDGLAPISTADRIVAAHHHLSPEQWAQLPALVQADMRESVAWELRAAS